MPHKTKEEKATYMRGYYQLNKEVFKSRARKWKIKHTRMIREYKKSHPCVRCGEKDYRCLSFHHLRDKRRNISAMPSSGYTWEKIEEEIAKCEILCANCHAREHYHEDDGF